MLRVTTSQERSPLLVKPQFPMLAGGIVPQMLIVVELLRRVFCLPVGPVDQGCIAEDDEFLRVARGLGADGR